MATIIAIATGVGIALIPLVLSQYSTGQILRQVLTELKKKREEL